MKEFIYAAVMISVTWSPMTTFLCLLNVCADETGILGHLDLQFNWIMLSHTQTQSKSLLSNKNIIIIIIFFCYRLFHSLFSGLNSSSSLCPWVRKQTPAELLHGWWLHLSEWTV